MDKNKEIQPTENRIMKQGIYVIRDKKSTYHLPFTLGADVLAIRSCQQALKNQELQMSQYPEDFALYKIGDYDDEKAKITAYEQPEKLVEMEVLKTKIEPRV